MLQETNQMKKLFLILLLSSSLSGCLWNVKKPDPPDNIKYVPVKTKCIIDKPEKPTMPFDNVKAESAAITKLKAALAEIEIRIGYEGKLEAAIDECNK